VAPTAQFEAHECADGGHEDYGEERADVDEQENLAQTPRQRQRDDDAEGEEDVAADGAAGEFVLGC
jgi:hypothetical protein